MGEILNLIVLIIGAVVVTTAIYHLVPFREWKNGKPKLVFFPKYSATFTGDKEAIVKNLKEMGFEAIKNSRDTYSRGKVYGDFSTKSLKLHAKIIKKENQLKVYAPYMGVFFDTGDLWSITSNAIHETKP